MAMHGAESAQRNSTICKTEETVHVVADNSDASFVQLSRGLVKAGGLWRSEAKTLHLPRIGIVAI